MSDQTHHSSSRKDPEYRKQVEQLIRRLGEAEGFLQAFATGEIDGVVDPATSAPILLSRAQAAVTRSQARYRDLVNRAPSLVCELSPDGETVFVNEVVRTILGYDPAELRGCNWWDTLVPPEARARAEEMRREVERQDVTAFEILLRPGYGAGDPAGQARIHLRALRLSGRTASASASPSAARCAKT